jgi:hypothetical protein
MNRPGQRGYRYQYHPRFTASSTPHLGELPVSPDLDLTEISGMGNGCYHKQDHIAQESEYEPALDRWSDMQVPVSKHMRKP